MSELERHKKIFEEEIKRKDKIIEELREQNKILKSSSLKTSEKIDKLTRKLKNQSK